MKTLLLLFKDKLMNKLKIITIFLFSILGLFAQTNVTFKLDMTQQTGFTTPEVNGTFNNWCGATCNPMTDANNDSIWEATIALLPGDYEYKFAYDNWAGQEALIPGSTCTVTNSGFTHRFLTVGSSAMVLPTVCWNSCSATCATPPVPVTFKVDMTQQTGFTIPEVNGSFNGWCGSCNPLTDINLDSIWETTILLAAGSYEYKFSHDAWTGMEALLQGTPCTNSIYGYTNRTLTVGSTAMVLPTVCYGSCSACVVSPPSPPLTACADSILWSNDFSSPSDWVINNTAGTPSLGWEFSSNPAAIPVNQLSPFASTTAANGFLFVNSDGNNSGDFDGTPIVTTATTSATIDLTGQPVVRLRYQHNFRWWHDTRGVSVSADNGATWTDFEMSNDANYSTPNQSSGNPEQTIIDISSIAGNQAQVKIRFYYNDHDWWGWYWAVDDAALFVPTIPEEPTGLSCWQTANLNTSTCSWDVSGTQEIAPGLSCWQTAAFNTETCTWDVSGEQAAQPTLTCYETAVFNTTTCAWVVSGPKTPQKMSYQAVIRNSNDSLLISTPVGMRISLVQGTPSGTVVFSETQIASTNANGLVSLQIGTGTVVTGTFACINWAAGPYYVKTETDLAGGTNYTIISSNEIQSVPYALFSENGIAPGTVAGEMNYWNGTAWVTVAPGTNNQNLTFCNGVPTWGPCPE
jgi:hypothetical protein